MIGIGAGVLLIGLLDFKIIDNIEDGLLVSKTFEVNIALNNLKYVANLAYKTIACDNNTNPSVITDKFIKALNELTKLKKELN